MARAILLTGLTLFVPGCGEPDRADPGDLSESIAGPISEFIVDTVASISDMELVTDSQLVLLDRRASPYLTVLDPRTGLVVAQFGRSGGGPGELTTPSQISTSALGRSQVEVLQGNARAVTRFDMSRGATLVERVELRTTGLELRSPPETVVLLDGGALITGEFQDGAVARVVSSSKEGTAGAMLKGPYLPIDFPDVLMFNANRHSSAYDAQNGQLAISYFYSSEVVVVDTLARAVQRWLLSSPGTPRRQENSPSPGFELTASEVAALRVAIGGGRVAVAHCGCLGENLDSLGRKITVFTIGQDSATLEFRASARVSGLALNAAGTQLFVSSNSPSPRVWVYDLER